MNKKDLVLRTDIIEQLEANLNGMKSFEFQTLKNGWFYFTALQTTWYGKMLVRVEKENYATKHQYKSFGEKGWNKLATDDRNDIELKKRGENDEKI